MSKLQWWCYLHVNGSVQAKRFMSWEDITEAKASDFVKDVMKPFSAMDRNDALRQGADYFGVKLDRSWELMKPAIIPEDQMENVRANCKREGLTEEQTEAQVQLVKETPIFKNNIYQCSVHEQKQLDPHFPLMWHLSIKRIDKEPVTDWRDIQRIKNDIIGPENEGVQLFPAESRLVDGANQYHLFVLKNEAVRFPFGFFDGRRVTDESPVGGNQRPGAG